MNKDKKTINKNVIFLLILIFSVIIILTGIFVAKTYIYPIKYNEQVKTYSKKYGLDPYLVLAVINTESKFDKDATSQKQAKGLMQIMDNTAKEMNDLTNSVEELTKEAIYDIDVNIELGCKYLASLISRYNGNYYLAICAYNAGIGNVNSWIDKGIIPEDLDTVETEIPFKETKNYLKKVIHYYEVYKMIYFEI